MSGAAEGIAGLALGAVSIAALFSTCIECFDIVIAAKDFSNDYEQLCTLFSLQRTRFGLWGESVGLIPSPINGKCLRYDKSIDRPDVRPGIERILHNVKSLLEEADRVDERYGLKSSRAQASEVSTSLGIDVFKSSFERFKALIKKNQKQNSVWKVTRWAIHDAEKFETMIGRLETYVDGLEKLTDSLGRLEKRLQEEIENISDSQSLALLRDATSGRRSISQHDISDTASRRLAAMNESILEGRSWIARSSSQGSPQTISIAKSKTSTITDIESGTSVEISAPRPVIISEETDYPTSTIQQIPGPRIASIPNSSCSERLEENHTGSDEVQLLSSSVMCSQLEGGYNFENGDLLPPNDDIESRVSTVHNETSLWVSSKSGCVVRPEDIPQNRRILNEAIANAQPPKPLSFEAGDARHGEKLRKTKDDDVRYLLQNAPTLLNSAESGASAVKRMFFELRNIRTGGIPFISAVPVGESLDKVLASIEGPPETPYEGGVFWITVRVSQRDPLGLLLLRFHTKIYHPNISPQGHICADYKEKWGSTISSASRNTCGNPNDVWYSKSKKVHWSLGALLVALCGLLASPDVEDPLVPEIAQKYLTDYDGYCHAARLYTQRYATPERPEEASLVFLDGNLPEEIFESSSLKNQPTLTSEHDRMSYPSFHTADYDECFPRANSTLSGSDTYHDRSFVDDSIQDCSSRLCPEAPRWYPYYVDRMQEMIDSSATSDSQSQTKMALQCFCKPRSEAEEGGLSERRAEACSSERMSRLVRPLRGLRGGLKEPSESHSLSIEMSLGRATREPSETSSFSSFESLLMSTKEPSVNPHLTRDMSVSEWWRWSEDSSSFIDDELQETISNIQVIDAIDTMNKR